MQLFLIYIEQPQTEELLTGFPVTEKLDIKKE
jgi:hypothetical protein